MLQQEQGVGGLCCCARLVAAKTKLGDAGDREAAAVHLLAAGDEAGAAAARK